MLRVTLRMTLILILTFVGVKVWYNRLENHLLSSLPEVKVAQTGPVEKKVEILRAPNDYKIILDRNIFGAALDVTDVVKSSEPVKELQQTKLKLSLMGTVFGDSKGSRAIISDEKTRKQDIYAVGDTVQGALIKSVERRRVVLNVNGRDEVLDIKDREGGGVSNTRLSSSPPSSPPRKSLRDRMSLRKPLVRPEPKSRTRPVTRSLGTRRARADREELENNMEISDEDLPDGPELLDEDLEDPELLDEEQ